MGSFLGILQEIYFLDPPRGLGMQCDDVQLHRDNWMEQSSAPQLANVYNYDCFVVT